MADPIASTSSAGPSTSKPNPSMKCGFADIAPELQCGIEPKYRHDASVVLLKQCMKDIKSHVRRLKIPSADFRSEWELIALRAGKFDLSSDVLNERTICPVHRYNLGLNWKPSRKCQHPLHPQKSKRRPRQDRAIGTRKSEEIYQEWNVLLPVGSTICKECDAQHREVIEKKSTHETVTEEQQPASPMAEGIQGGGDDDSSSADSSAESIIKGGHLLQVPESSNGDSQSSEEQLEVDMSWAPTPAPRNFDLAILNRFLQQGGYDSVDGQLLRPLEEASASTVRYYKRKAKETIGLALHLLAPGQEDKLMSAIQSAALPDDTLASALVECYTEATSWYTKRQILSILAPNRTKEQLLEMIPGLTVYRIDEARKHAREVGQAQPVQLKPVTRSRLDDVKVDHFLDFVSRPDFVQDVAYGTKTMKLSHGEKIDIPNIVRTVIASRTISLYQAFCEETGFEPLKRSSLFSIIQVCAASHQKSLAGLDNIAAEGSEAFELFFTVLDTLAQCGYSSAAVEELKSRGRAAKLYLKSDYKLHISLSDPCPDHCITFALADGSIQCTHPHDVCCKRCDDLRDLLETTEAMLEDPSVEYRYDKQKEEIMYDYEAAKDKIFRLKAHILRAKNQEFGKTDILERLTENQALATMDWAMKFLPTKFRESQQDWFGKKGISWHVTAVVSKEKNEFQIHCYVHVIDQCKQDWFSVFSVIEATLLKVKVDLPKVTEVFLRSDNAGCYHNASLLLALPSLSKQLGLKIKRYDFSEAQAGKDICDRKIAPMKSHIQRYVNEGHDVTTAADMVKALGTYGGVRGCYVAEVTLDDAAMGDKTTSKWPGVTSYTNFEFEDTGKHVRIWKAYNIGSGTQHSVSSGQQGTSCVQVGTYTQPRVETGAISGQKTSVEIACSEVGCVQVFPTHEALTLHMAVGQHDAKPLSDTKMDRIKRKWAGKFCDIAMPGQTSAMPVPSIASEQLPEEPRIQAGWAHRIQRVHRRYSQEVHTFLQKEFMKGVRTGMKENPVDVSRKLKASFGKEHWLTTQQIAAYFSRLSAKQKCSHPLEKEHDEGQESAVREVLNRRSLRIRVMKEAGL